MIDVNLVAQGNLASLLSLECERLNLEYKISSSPITGAKSYIIDSDFCQAKSPFPKKTVLIGNNSHMDGGYALENPFLLADLRKILKEIMLCEAVQEKKLSPKKQSNAPKLFLDGENQAVTLRGHEIALSPTEFKILSALVAKKGELLTHEEINALIGGEGSNKANVYICFLRKKLEARGDKLIHSIRGKGFMIK